LEIRNKNFICKKMQLKDISKAFEFKGKAYDFIYNVLLEEDYLRKIGDRYFTPTEKLLDAAFLPKMLLVKEHQRRYLSNNAYFYRVDIVNLFGGNLMAEQIVKKLIKDGYLLLDDSKRYRISTHLEDFLGDGEDTFHWEKGETT